MKVFRRVTLSNVRCNDRLFSNGSSHLIISRCHWFCSQSKDPKENKDENEKKEDDESIFSLFKNVWSWSQKAAEEMTQNKQSEDENQSDGNTEEDNAKWASMLSEIRKNNEFNLDIDPHCFQEYTTYFQISQTEFMHKTMMKVNYYPLKFDEFMVGAHQGFEFILKGMEQNDVDGFDGVIVGEMMEKMEEIKGKMMDDDKYKCVGKIMSILKDVRNAPNFKDKSIDAAYTVRYYYQLKCPTKEESEKEEQRKSDDGNNEQEYIQKRCDVKWRSKWLPVPGGWMGSFKITEDGWKIEDIQCADVPKRTKQSKA